MSHKLVCSDCVTDGEKKWKQIAEAGRLWGGNKVNLSFFGGENKQLVGRGEMIHTVNIGF